LVLCGIMVTIKRWGRLLQRMVIEMGLKKAPPVILKVECLSTGIDPFMIDDITGDLVPQPYAVPPIVDNAQEWIDAKNREKYAATVALLNEVGIAAKHSTTVDKSFVKPLVSPTQYNKISDKLPHIDADDCVVIVRRSLPNWRRL
jgi:hypothetical protein